MYTDGPRQRTLCYLGELNDSSQARWLKVIDAFNEQDERRQLKLFPSDVELPGNDPHVCGSPKRRPTISEVDSLVNNALSLPRTALAEEKIP